MPRDPYIREKFTRDLSFARQLAKGILRKISEGSIQDRDRELAPDPISKYRVHHEAIAGADRTQRRSSKMTLVAVWRHDPGRIHAIADTRISDGPGSVYTDHGPKILPITMICRQPGPSGFFDQVKYRHEFGFAFAGSTLTALSGHALANILCGNLGGQPNALPPSLDEIARAVEAISLQYTKEIGATGGSGSAFMQTIGAYRVLLTGRM
jgi:hypothetical protein